MVTAALAPNTVLTMARNGASRSSAEDVGVDAFHWNHCFVTGLAEVDAQHHHLAQVINRFGNLVMREDDASAQALEAVFTELAAYAQYHFNEEEALMEATHLDARHVVHHQRSHRKFLHEATQLHRGVLAHKPGAARSLLQYLTDWLAYHIQGSDRAMARQIAAVRAGLRPEEAYLAETSRDKAANTTVLSAANA